MVEPLPVYPEPDVPPASRFAALRLGGSLYAFTFPNFRLFFFGQLVSVAGTWMQTVAQQWLVYNLTHSAVWLGIVSGATALPYAAFALWGGSIADRVPRRTILLRTQTVAMCLALMLAGLATNRVVAIAPWHIAVFAALGAVVQAFNMPAQQAFASETVGDPKALPNAIALNSLRFNTARFLGPLLAGITLVHLGAAWCFFLNGVSFIAVLASLLRMRIAPRQPGTSVNASGSPLDGARFLTAMPSLLRTVLLVGAASLSVLAVSTLFPVLADVYKRDAGGFSTLVTANGLGAMGGGLLVVTLAARMPGKLRVYGGAVVLSLALLCLSFAPVFVSALTCLFFAGVGMVTFLVSANTKIQTETPDHLRGRVMAMYLLVANTLIPVGGLLLGLLAQRYSVLPTIRFAAVATLAVTAILWAWQEQSRAAR